METERERGLRVWVLGFRVQTLVFVVVVIATEVAIHSFPLGEPIRELCTKHLNKLVNVNGVVTKRSVVQNQVTG